MKLTQDQIAKIKKFIHSRGFTTIEVEMEILDHVASAVEVKLEENPDKSLTKAIHEVHSSFGVLGFSVMDDEFNKSFRKLSGKAFVDILFSYIYQKNALITLSIFIAFFLLGNRILPFENGFTYQIFFYALGVATALFNLAVFRRMNKWYKRSLVVSSFSGYVAFAYLIFGQFFGSLTKIEVDSGMEMSSALFALFSTIIILNGLIFSNLLNWAFNWTNERYLKYA
jgi:hypothetical protein